MKIIIELDKILDQESNKAVTVENTEIFFERSLDENFDIFSLRKEIDKFYLEKALDQCNGCREKAARLVKLTPTTFKNRLSAARIWLNSRHFPASNQHNR